MGMIRITTWGSFRSNDKQFAAQTSGHAVAIEDAIRYLRDELLPEAIRQDKWLRAQGHAPNDNFAEADKRDLLK
jgi:hypothetical protein